GARRYARPARGAGRPLPKTDRRPGRTGPLVMDSTALHDRIDEIRQESNLLAIGVHVHDHEDGREFSHEGDRWFHAASTMKAAVLLALFKAAEAGRVRLEDRLHVRNRFRSIADRSIYNISRDRDADAAVHRRIGRSMKLIEL